ncbi:CsbD family protein [Streptomyces tateyamensis]|uniref:CsbD family protein n=1 Tax=Streptomyces tateyamensis TaxID=565073 RepID=A0A2V4PRJ7_9ACTN|nr:CsbD family protein [Streptomyces tateyamensis]PYC87605.1 CsbD family protein [Streptomyces tateyamensis]
MSAGKKAKHTAQTVKGKAKEATGKAVGNERLAAKGKAEQVKGDTFQAGQKAKDALKH